MVTLIYNSRITEIAILLYKEFGNTTFSSRDVSNLLKNPRNGSILCGLRRAGILTHSGGKKKVVPCQKNRNKPTMWEFTEGAKEKIKRHMEEKFIC